MNNMHKRGEISTSTIVAVILLIAGFAILLFFYWQLNFTERVDKDVCHQSVIFRATLPSFGGAKEFVPLKCKTEKVCVTSKLLGQNCQDFKGTSGITTARVKNSEDSTGIEKVIAQRIFDCWSMMGEGKVSIFAQWLPETYALGSVYPSCVICSRIAFDKSSLKSDTLYKVNVDRYMATRLVPDKEVTYADYFAQKGGRIAASSQLFDVLRDEAVGAALDDLDTLSNDIKTSLSDPKLNLDKDTQDALAKLDTALKTTEDAKAVADSSGNAKAEEEIAILFMQVSAPKQFGSLINSVEALLGLSAAASHIPGSNYAFNGLGKLCAAWPIGTAICAVTGIVAVGVQQVSAYGSRSIAASYCGDVVAGDEAREGCSTVRVIRYNESYIAKNCGVIESIP